VESTSRGLRSSGILAAALFYCPPAIITLRPVACNRWR
jgi:hypothetical protein